MAHDPADACSDATKALNVIAAIRRQTGRTAAQLVTDLNTLLEPIADTGLDPISLAYVNAGITKAGAFLVNTAGVYTLANPNNYAVRSGDSDIALGGTTAVPGYTW